MRCKVDYLGKEFAELRIPCFTQNDCFLCQRIIKDVSRVVK